MLHLKDNLLVAIVNRNQGEHFAQCARDNGASGATIIPAKGTASNAILRLLCIGDTEKDIVLVVTPFEKAKTIIEQASGEKKLAGVAAIVASEGCTMESRWKIINIIVNSGYADDVMETARKAGATGGTVTRARGTAVPGKDNRFMGVTIVPDKEMIMILAKSDTADSIADAVSSMECLKEPGVGILFMQDVTEFRNLGGK